MKIKKITVWKENLNLTRPYAIAYETIDCVENLFVRIDADNGLTGIGAGSPAEEVTGETIAAGEAALVENLESIFLNKDIRFCRSMLWEMGTILSHTPAAMAAADIALHDLVAKGMDMPLVDILGRVHTRLPTSITIGIKPVQETLEEAREYLANGFSILKIKTGRSVDEDIEKVRRLHETFSSDIRIRVDANQGYDQEALSRFYHDTSGMVEFIEQPLKAADVEKMRQMPEPVRTLSAADETLLSPKSCLNLFHPPRPFGIFNIKLMKCGGVAPGLEIAGMAHHAGIDLMWGAWMKASSASPGHSMRLWPLLPHNIWTWTGAWTWHKIL